MTYVDGLLVVGSKSPFKWVKSSFRSWFSTIELGPCKNYLGVLVERTDSDCYMSQEAFTRKVIDLAVHSDAKPTPSSLSMSRFIYENREEISDDERVEMKSGPNWAILGYLLNLYTPNRLDITTAVSMLAKFQCSPSLRH